MVSARSMLSGAVDLGRIGWRVHRARRAKTPDERDRAHRRVLEFIGARHGLSAKIGQLLAAGGTEAYAETFADLPPVPISEIEGVLAKAWGTAPHDVVMELGEAVAAASFGQVHRCRMRGDGSEVAIKVRYPGIQGALAGELTALGLVPGLGPMKRWGFDIQAYKLWLNETFDAELDYRREAVTQEGYRAAAARVAHPVVVPRVESVHCRDEVLVQRWEPGLSAAEAGSGWTARQRRIAAERFVGHVLGMALGQGLLHADLHRGNVAFRDDPQRGPLPVIYDYGCVLAVTPSERDGFVALLDALEHGQAVDPAACLAGLGFDRGKLRHLEGRLPAVCRLLLEPFLSDRPFDTATWRLDDRMQRVLGEHCWWFRSAGSPRFLLMMRAMQGMVAQVKALDVRINWHRIWRDLRIGLPEPDIEVTRAVDGARTCSELARELRIRVVRDGRQRVDLRMPATVLEDLVSVMDEDLRTRVEADGHDVDRIADRAIANGYPIGILFSCRRDGDDVTLSLE